MFITIRMLDWMSVNQRIPLEEMNEIFPSGSASLAEWRCL